MHSTLKFKYPIFYTIVFALTCLMMMTIVLGIGITSIMEGGLFKNNDEWSTDFFGVIISVLMPGLLFFLGVVCAKRLRYSFVEITLDEDEHKVVYKQGKKVHEIKFNEIISSQDLPNKGILVLMDRFKGMSIPKEVSNYLHLYKKLEEKGLLKESIDFNHFKTNLGLMHWFILAGLLIFGLIPLVLLPDLILKFDGSSDAIIEVSFLSALSFFMILIGLLLTNRYEFTEKGLLKKNPIYKKLIQYTNIKHIEYLETRRALMINLTNDKLEWLRKLNGQSGIEIQEPGNISIEKMYTELERRVKQAKTDVFFLK
jgi:hypothetical protein